MRIWIYEKSVTVGAFLVRSLERMIARASLIGNPPFFVSSQFQWVKQLEDNWPAIRREVDAILPRRAELPNFQDISRDQAFLSQDDGWKTFFFYAYGIRADGNCARCPETTRVIESIPGMKTAFFSILSPGKHIPLHRGPYKGVIRAHLGLLVPEPKEQCRIQVGPEFAHWEEGKVMVFDDSYPHQVWNDTKGVRVVLFLDIVRPLRFPMNVLNAGILKLIAWSPFIKDAETNYKRWEKEFDRPAPPPPATARVA
ncbi:MAG TPA: aspartyl/asparaginyl beta-hydroxylase domain-containing protein [Gemmatimonadales bacterium]|nr:aspartyl/asparaginyl beta-hydroxylase domain-containing protein [Gemmatimonadales bacterium]